MKIVKGALEAWTTPGSAVLDPTQRVSDADRNTLAVMWVIIAILVVVFTENVLFSILAMVLAYLSYERVLITVKATKLFWTGVASILYLFLSFVFYGLGIADLGLFAFILTVFFIWTRRWT